MYNLNMFTQVDTTHLQAHGTGDESSDHHGNQGKGSNDH